VNPQLYGVEPPADNYSDLDRDRVDYEILNHAEAAGKPVFGICRGCQVMNVFRGGNLSLHYSEQVDTDTQHSCTDYSGPAVHSVSFVPSSDLGQFVQSGLGKTSGLSVNSIHRQVVKDLGRGLQVACHSHDGLVEAVEDVKSPEQFFAVQWHPERAPGMNRDQLSRLLFTRLIEAANRFRKR
jgi:putative glutamine amidotransferase